MFVIPSNFAPPTRMKKRETALHFAAKEGKKEMIESLVNSKADIDIDARDTVGTGIACLTNIVLIRITFLENLCDCNPGQCCSFR